MNNLTENRKFRVDDNVIYHLIESQGGSLVTAIRELIQNSFDANATECYLTITEEGFKLIDNGKGFKSQEEIFEFFEKFGTPHLENSNTTFGRFRLGRGQIMSFASTVWQSNNFKMSVCLKTKGLNYDFDKTENIQEGCVIEGKWYVNLADRLTTKSRLYYDSLHDIVTDLKRELLYLVNIKVYLNGKKINDGIETTNWTEETDDYYFYLDKESKRGIHIYNLGVFVRKSDDENLYIPGVNGTLVTKKHLKLDISRTKISHDCKLINKISNDLLKYKPKKRKVSVTFFESAEIIEDFLENRIDFSEFINLKVFFNYHKSKAYSIMDIYKQTKQITFVSTELGSYEEKIIVDKIIQRKSVIVLTSDNLLGSIKQLNDYLEYILNGFDEGCDNWHIIKSFLLFQIKYIELKNEYVEEFEVFAEESLTENTKILLKSLRNGFNLCRPYLREINRKNVLGLNLWQKIRVGYSATANAWTNGLDEIVFNESKLILINQGVTGCGELVAIYLHELCHSNKETTGHDYLFYKTYHDLSISGNLSHLTMLLNLAHYRNITALGKKQSAATINALPAKESFKKYSVTNLFITGDNEFYITIETKLNHVVSSVGKNLSSEIGNKTNKLFIKRVKGSYGNHYNVVMLEYPNGIKRGISGINYEIRYFKNIKPTEKADLFNYLEFSTEMNYYGEFNEKYFPVDDTRLVFLDYSIDIEK